MVILIVRLFLLIFLLLGNAVPFPGFMSQLSAGDKIEEIESIDDMDASLGDFTPLDVSDDGIEITYDNESYDSAGE